MVRLKADTAGMDLVIPADTDLAVPQGTDLTVPAASGFSRTVPRHG
jgi:hypothetical protein